MDESQNPLTSPPPAEVLLRDPPLAMALAQVRFPPILSVNNPVHIAGFQESIRGDFPEYVNSAEDGQPVVGGLPIPFPPLTHQFMNEAGWAVSLCQNFMAISTKTADAYQNRDDFIERFKSVVESLHTNLKPSHVSRLGIRFVNRVSDADEMRNLEKFIRADFLGPEVSRRVSDDHPQIGSRAILPAREGKIIANWGFLAPNEPILHLETVAALPQPCWMLDLDIFTSEMSGDFNPDVVSQKAREFVDRVYAVFRHVFLSEFIRKHEG